MLVNYTLPEAGFPVIIVVYLFIFSAYVIPRIHNAVLGNLYSSVLFISGLSYWPAVLDKYYILVPSVEHTDWYRHNRSPIDTTQMIDY